MLIVATIGFSFLLLSLRYWLLPDIERYRETIASVISEASGQHITLGGISANWDGFRPHMMLRTIKVHDKAGNISLLLHQVEGTLSWRSLLHGELRFREIGIEQPDLIVHRDSSGAIHVAGFALASELTGDESGFSDWLLRQGQVIINNASILWRDDLRGAPDADGRVMRSTVRAVADELASAAELALGKTGARPVAIVRGASFTRGEGRIADVVMPAANDLFP